MRVPARRAAGVASCLVMLAGGGTVLTACDVGKPTVATSATATPSRAASGGRIASRTVAGHRVASVAGELP